MDKTGRIKDENYYQIQGWMLNRLNLSGTDLLVYAIIYGFSQDGESEFTGSINYLCEFTGTSRPTIIKSLKGLCESGKIEKHEEIKNGVTFNRYKASLQGVKNFNWGSKETLLGGSKETLPNNKESYNKIDSIEDKERKKEVAEKKAQNSFNRIILDYTQNPETIRLLGEWLKVRKSKRAAMTDYAIQLNLEKLDKLAEESNLSVDDYLKEVIMRGWTAFFPIKQHNEESKPKEEETKRWGGIYL